MRKVSGWSVAVALGVFATAVAARADEEKVPLDKLPRAVADAVKARFRGAKLTGAAKEKEEGKTVYEVTLRDKDHGVDVTLTPEGKIVGIEKQIAARDLPRAVSEALEAKYPKADYKTVEEVIKVKGGEEKLESYEVLLITADKKKIEVVVSPEGKITKVEDKNEEKEREE
jgi:hypothetical protein